MLGKSIKQIIEVGDQLKLGVLCGLIILLPSVYLQDLANPTESSKLVFFYYGLLTVIAIFLIPNLFLTTKSVKIHITSADLLLFFLIIYITLNRYIFQPYFGFSQKFCQLVGLTVLYVILRNFPVNRYIYLLLAVLFGSFLQALNGILQLMGFVSSNSIFVITGNFANPGSYAGFLAISGVLALGTYLFSDQLIKFQFESQPLPVPGKKKIVAHLIYFISLMCLVSVLIILPALRSRAAWIGFATGSCFLLTIKYNWHKSVANNVKSIRIRVLVAAILILILAAGTVGIYQYKKDSADGRLLIYKVTSKIVKAHPVIGVGFDRFKAKYMLAQANWFAGKRLTTESELADNTYYAFNEPLQFTVENGLIGLLLISLTALIFINLKTNSQHLILKQLSLGTLSAVFVLGFFTYISDNLPLTMIVIITLALLANIDTATGFFNLGSGLVTARIHVVYKGILLPLLVGFIWSGVQFTQGIQGDYKIWASAGEAYYREDYTTSIRLFKKVNYFLYDDGDYLMQYGKATSMAGSYGEAIRILNSAKLHLSNTVIEIALGDSFKALKRYSEAEQAYMQATNMVPGRFYPHFLLAKLYESTGENAKALFKAREILSKKIKIPSTAITEMRNEMKMLVAKNERKLLLNNSIKVTN